jgi:hypothetical protein
MDTNNNQVKRLKSSSDGAVKKLQTIPKSNTAWRRIFLFRRQCKGDDSRRGAHEQGNYHILLINKIRKRINARNRTIAVFFVANKSKSKAAERTHSDKHKALKSKVDLSKATIYCSQQSVSELGSNYAWRRRI